MNRSLFLLPLLALIVASSARGQEFLDTAGRWKYLDLPGQELGSGVVPRAIAANDGRVVIAREAGDIVVSSDSGVSWTGDANLPSGVTVLWAMTFPEPVAQPLRLLGVATTSQNPPLPVLVESTDGGLRWQQLSRLPDLDRIFAVPVDTMRLYGPPAFQFLPRSAGVLRGFLSSAAGLLVTEDGGRTWTRRGEELAIRSLKMQDALNGVASFGRYRGSSGISAQPGGISWTSDGGATWTETYSFTDGGYYQWVTIESFGSSVFRVLLPERFQNYIDWRLLRSSDGGRTWGEHRGRHARRPVYGPAFFRDTTDVHIISDGAIMSHSADGGELFYVLRDTTRYWWQTPLDDIPGYVTKAPLAARDARYIYLTVPGNRAARWRLASVEPLSGVDDLAEPVLTLAPNPAATRSLWLRGLGDPASVEVRDLLGRPVMSVRMQPGDPRLDLAPLAPGQYFVVVATRGRQRCLQVRLL